jgi:hypothetical protein
LNNRRETLEQQQQQPFDFFFALLLVISLSKASAAGWISYKNSGQLFPSGFSSVAILAGIIIQASFFFFLFWLDK